MQEFTDPTAMNSPYSATTGGYGSPDAPNAPKLGTPIPGTTGGLPQKPGLSVAANPLAPALKSDGSPIGYDYLPSDTQQAAPTAYPAELPMAGQQQQPTDQQTDEQQQEQQSYAGGGLASLTRPAAEATRQMGRGQDTMLVHMTPAEVNSLQGLAMATGGSLTINPHTGLPEAGWLGKLLPTLLGAGLTFIPGIGPLAAAGIVGGGQTLLTGDLKKGLLAGLGAYGGASLAGALAPSAAGNVALGANAGGGGASQLVAQNAAKMGAEKGFVEAAKLGVTQAGTEAAKATAQTALKEALANQVTKAPGLFAKFGAEAAGGLGGLAAKAAPMVAGLGLMTNVSNAFSPSGVKMPSGQIDNSYQGPYRYQERTPTFAKGLDELLSSSAERDYFSVDQPELYNMQGQMVQPGSETAPGTPLMQRILNPNAGKNQPMYSFQSTPYMQDPEAARREQLAQLGIPFMAKGGKVELADGAFVVDARTVSELGNGSSGAGQELLARLGGRPVRGPGDGVSDSVPARIGRDQPARVARDEVIFSPEAVRKVGKGNQKRGAQKLYAMMEKAHKARKKAERGTDTKLRKGLA